MTWIGRSVARLEDPPLVRGEGRFAADVSFPGQVYMRVVRSAIAHGALCGVATEAARALSGVVAVWSAADIAGLPPIPIRLTRVPGLDPYRQPVLARERVRYVGEPVAAVFADSAYVAEDAAELVEADIVPLPPVLDAADAPGEFDPGLSTEPTVISKAYGDVDAAFAAADIVVALDLHIGRHSGVPLECRGAVARCDATRDRLELHGAAKVPHWNRDAIATMLGRAPESVQLFENHVGGGFGVRGELYPEDVLVCLAALRLGRPVKWVEDRREHFLATNHSRQQRHRARIAATRDGRLLAIETEFFHDQGAYVRTHGATVPDLTAAMLPGPYEVPAYRAAGHLRLTDKTPCGTYRAPGRFESTFVRERLMDALAARLGLDPVELRRRNLIPRERMPYARPLDTLGTHVVLDSGDYAGLLDKALARVGWEELQAVLSRRRDAGALVGAGLAVFVEKSGLGPSDDVRIEIDADGRVEIVTGAASLGQGIETVIAQICADALGVPLETISVTHGQTDRIARGFGAFASRVTVMTGAATQMAAQALRAKVLGAAAELLQTTVDALTLRSGRVVVAAEGGRAAGENDAKTSVALADLMGELAALGRARAATAAWPHSSTTSRLSAGENGPVLSAEATFMTDHMTYPYGVHIAVVAVDRDTGAARVERYLVAYDIGRAVNPRLVEGQLVGGVAQGIGGALFEELAYDGAGEPLSVTFADYLVPTAAEIPSIEVLLAEDAPSPLNPLGLKGAGEGGANAAGAAIASAIDAALGRPGAVTRLPVTPARMRELMPAGGRVTG